MKQIISQVGRLHIEHFVVDLEEPTKINFVQQVEDVIISSPDIDVLIGSDYVKDEDFTEMNCMLVKPQDNMKELTRDFITTFYLMPKNKGEKGRVYVMVQR